MSEFPQSDHDLLVQIFTLQTERNKQFLSHCEDASAEHETFHKTIAAAHRRIDALMVSGILALLFFGFTVWFKVGGKEAVRQEPEERRSNFTWESPDRGEGLRNKPRGER